MMFDELPVGAKFRFFRRGALRTKVSAKAFDLNGIQLPGSADTLVFPEEASEIDAADAQREPKTSEDLAREMLRRMGISECQKFTSVQLAELVALIESKSR